METLQVKLNNQFEFAAIVDLNGELMQIRIADTSRANVGDYLLCLYYGKDVSLRVLAVSDESIFLLTPYKQKDVFSDQRKAVRITTQLNALLNHTATHQSTPIIICDFSHRGIGFASADASLDVMGNYEMVCAYDSTEPFRFTIQIMHKNAMFAEECRYGASISEIGKDEQRLLRSLIIREQLRHVDVDKDSDHLFDLAN